MLDEKFLKAFPYRHNFGGVRNRPQNQQLASDHVLPLLEE